MPPPPAKRPTPPTPDARVGPPPWAKANHDQRREIIVQTAMQLLAEDGPDAVTMRRVAKHIGVGTMTLYTYIDGQTTLHHEMVRRGMAMLNEGCRESSTIESDGSWRGGARHYIQFAIDHPNLFRLMFDTPLPKADQDLLRGGFQPLLERVMQRLKEKKKLTGKKLEREAKRQAGRYWLAVHGLAMLAIADRLSILEGDVDQLLDDLLPHVSPE